MTQEMRNFLFEWLHPLTPKFVEGEKDQPAYFSLQTPFGKLCVPEGDWIVRRAENSYSHVKADDFDDLYEVDE